MKYFPIYIFAMILNCCEKSEIIYEYPDGISQPDIIKESHGCGNIFVYQYIDSLKVLTVWINADEYNLTEKCQYIDLSGSSPSVSVMLQISPNNPDSIYFNFCNDVVYPNEGETIKYKAISGKLYFSVSEDNPIKDPIWQTFYNVTIRIENLCLYYQANDDEFVIKEIVFWDVGVGWLPG